MRTKGDLDPIGGTARDGAARRYQRSAAYREQHDRLAPYRSIARAVILARSARGWTQQDLAERLGTSNTAVSRIESGRHGVNLETLRRLAAVLELTFTVAPDQLQAAPQHRTMPGRQRLAGT
jgi:ribosome-binding protein aMBF1 (putative translation factor)